MKTVSAVIITCNEEKKIEAALRSVRSVADEIVVVDSFSTDRTTDICRRYTERVLQKGWQGYRQQKQFATDAATHDWVLSLDADEAVSPELERELLMWKQRQEDTYQGYCLARKTFFMGRWIEHTTWYPDWQLRLFRRSCGRWQGGRVHESFQLAGLAGKFRHHLYHYTYSNLSEYLSQLEIFSSLAAADYYDRGVRATMSRLLFYPPIVFLKNYFLKLGFLDGIPGLVVSMLSALSTAIKFLKLWELQRVKAPDPKL